IIPKRIFETGSSVMFATDTFLQQYMRASDDGGMSSLRIAVCGAERVKDETRQAAEKRFSFEVLEGYGVTEGSPVLAANQPGDIRSGTVGKLLPGVEHRLEPVEGLPGAGRLFVRGVNIMKGYITPDAPGVVKPPPDGWHDTGDIVAFDDAGYMSIRGRLKRFAKIGGEMVSLAVVENCATAVWPDNMHAAAILPDDRKGEQIVLITDKAGPDRSLLLAWAQSHGVPELAVPKKIVAVDAVPVLGTGKLDYVAVTKLAAEGLEALEAAKNAPPPLSEKELKQAARLKRIAEKRLAKEARKAAKEAERAAKEAERTGARTAVNDAGDAPKPAEPQDNASGENDASHDIGTDFRKAAE
ncbi:MAG: AMP-binding protein, partial [Parvularculaceae bacterium]|nr:AMP-binding protein [Parvularculaceae bacterium]